MPSEIDVKEMGFSAYHQRDRAVRAVERFRLFENAEAKPEAIWVLLDEFLEAAETTWHVKDHVEHELDEMAAVEGYQSEAEAGREAFHRLVNGVRMQELRLIANVSKHGKLREPGQYEGTVVIRFQGARRGEIPDGALSDVYRRMELRFRDGHIEHPTDFLENRIGEWANFMTRHLNLNVGRKLALRIASVQ